MSAQESNPKADFTAHAKKGDAREVHLVISGRTRILEASEQYRPREDLQKALYETKSSEARLRKIIDTIPTLACSNSACIARLS